MPSAPTSHSQTITSHPSSISPSISNLSKSSDSNPKRNRAIRLGHSIRKAGHSLNPRAIVDQRNQQSNRLKSSIHSLDSNPTTTTTTTTTNPASTPTIRCSVPMTPISLECNPFDLEDCITARPDDSSTNDSFTSSELPPTPAPSRSHLSFQNQVTNSDQTEPTADAMPSPPFSPILRSIHPPTFSAFSPSSHFDEPSTPLSFCHPHPSPSPSSSSTYHHDQDNSSLTGSPYHSRYPSQSILTIALAKARTAVQLDTALQIPEAIRAYTEAVLLLEEVIDKIDVMSKEREQREHEGLMRDQARDRIWAEELWKRLGRDDMNHLDREELESRLRERERRWREKKRKMEKRKTARVEEEDRLIGIHNTYASRIAELQAEVLSASLTIIDPDQDPVDPSMIPFHDQEEPIEQPASRSNPSSQHHDQLVYPTLAEAERSSISSDSTTRGAVSSEPHETRAILQSPTLETTPLTSRDSQAFIKSLETAEEEKDVVSERLATPLHHTSSHSQNSRNRSSSSISGASLSQLARPQSIESITTTRTSISSTAHKGELWLPTGLNKPIESQSDPIDRRKRFSISHPTASHNPPASRHATRLSIRNSISVRPESPSTVVATTPSNHSVTRRSSEKFLVSSTTAQGTISRRRRSPTCLDAKGRSLLRSGDYAESKVLPLLQPSSGNQIAISMDRRPSNVSLMYTAPSPAIPLRLRSYSQPGKRPTLLSFMADKTPPVPNSPIRTESLQSSSRLIPRQCSSPLINPPLANSDLQDHSVSRSTSFILSPSPLGHAPSTSSHSHDLSARSDSHRGSVSPAVYGIQPYAHATPSTGSIMVGGPAPVGVLPAYPKSASRRPFHLMRQISTSISSGAYVSARLYVPRQMWHQVQVKLHGLETKIKLMDTLLAGLELVERDGALLVGGGEGWNKDGGSWDMAADGGRQISSAAFSSQVLNATERFMKRLEIFEELLDNLQSGGAKKLGLHANGPHETAYGQDAMRKGGGFGTLMAHKLGKGLDRITQRSNSDLPSSYIETIARLFDKSQAIDVHLASLEHASRSHSLDNGGGVGAGSYNSIGQQSKQQIEGRLRRVSEFYSTVVCRFVVADMGVLLDKYVKKGGNWCGD